LGVVDSHGWASLSLTAGAYPTLQKERASQGFRVLGFGFWAEEDDSNRSSKNTYCFPKKALDKKRGAKQLIVREK
jgi:hypothetical protein